MLITTANVCEAPRHDNTIDDDFREIGRKVDAGVIAWQEIGNAVYKAALLKNMPKHWEHYFARPLTGYESPISFDTRHWRLMEYGATQLHPTTTGILRQRWITHVVLEARDSGKQLAVTNRHYVARAFAPDGSEGPRTDPKEREEQPVRQKLWFDGLAVDQDLLAGYAKRDLPIVAAGDFNRNNVLVYGEKFHRRRVTASVDGVCAIYMFNGGKLRWTVDSPKQTIATHSDHDVLVQRAGLRKN